MGKLFGTDGIRGTANRHPMTPEMAMLLGKAIAHKMAGQIQHPPGQKPKILIGKDTRLSGYMLEMALASGICSMGVNVLLVGPLPTPGIAFLTHNMRADAGIVVSASHNPFEDNGIKIFGRDGFKLPIADEEEIENQVLSGKSFGELPTAAEIGKARRIDDAIGRYVIFVKNTFPKDLTLEGLKIVLDCANGAAYKVAPWVFEELGAEVIKIGVHPDGKNINANCGALYPEQMAKLVQESGAHLGVSLDGDADRCVLCDEKGQIINGDHILQICASDMNERGQLSTKTIVATQMSSFGLTSSLRKKGIGLLRTDVGDKYVVEAMRAGGHALGGEQSGHIIFLENSTTGDGLIAALRVLTVMQKKKRRLSELASELIEVPQILHAVRVKKRSELSTIPGYQDLEKKISTQLGDAGRLFVRFSGTEPVVRILIEGSDKGFLEKSMTEVEQLLKRELGA